ncbi:MULTISPECIES: hypothetical protein [Parafrankia]|nr:MULTISPECIES: hypothetical protein [Parafrankia]MBE3204349.1 hypothetical protein [Parafrankia sp. CH37]
MARPRPHPKPRHLSTRLAHCPDASVAAHARGVQRSTAGSYPDIGRLVDPAGTSAPMA